MSSKRVVLVTATRSESMEEFQKRPIYKSLSELYEITSRDNFDFVVVTNNKRGLSSVYNECLAKEDFAKDILLFVHDDVEIEDLFLVSKLQNSPYEVTGLAGSKKVDLTKDAAWHLMSEREDMVGEVAHTKDSNVWTSVFGSTNSRALLLDGLFLAVDVEDLNSKGAKFDEEFEFHHYDLAFGLNCNEAKVACGVLPIRVVHHGLGDSMLSKEWRESAKKFTEKFNKPTNE